MKKLTSLLAVCLGIVVLCSNVNAADEDQTGWHAGATVLAATLHTDDDVINDAGIGFRLFGQYRFNPWFAAEAAYFNAGKATSSATSAPPPAKEARQSYRGFMIDGVMYVPTPLEGLELLFRGGYFDFRTELMLDGYPVHTANDNGATAGAGVSIRVSDKLKLRTVYDWYDVRRAKLWSLGVGLDFQF